MSQFGERGQALPLVGFSLMVLLGFGAVAVDIGYIDYQQQRMQSATDAAAIAGAQQLIKHGCPDQADATTSAQKDAQTKNFALGPNAVFTVDNPPKSTDGPYQGAKCAVYVGIKVPQTTTWFLRLFDKPSLPVSTSAVALVEDNNPTSIVLLNPSATSSFNGATINAPNSSILINGRATFSGATVNAKSIGYAGGVPSGGSFTGSPPAPMLPTRDVCAEMAGCASMAANPPSTSSCMSTGGKIGSVTLNPGCYSNLDVSGSRGGAVTFNPGIYVLTGTSNFNKGVLAGTGVTFYVTETATPPDFSTSGGHLSAPTSGTYSNVLYYQVPANSGNPKFGGGLNRLSGLIYAPSASNVSYASSTGDVAVVFGGADFTSAKVSIPNAPTFLARVVLVQ
jgi:Flp pilus assembly protein TadG